MHIYSTKNFEIPEIKSYWLEILRLNEKKYENLKNFKPG